MMTTVPTSRSSNVTGVKSLTVTTSSLHDTWIYSEWLAAEILAIFMCVVVLYFTIAMLCCGIFQLNTKTGKELVFSRILHAMCMLCGLCCLVFNAVQIPMISSIYEPYCYYYEKVLVVTFGLAVMSTYLVLWLRMLSAFYMNPVVSSNIPKKLRYFAFGTCAVIQVMIAVYIGVFLATQPYKTFEKGCLKVGSFGTGIIKWAIVGTTTALGQGCLLFYFIYPLYMHRRNMLSSGINEKSTIPLIKRLALMMTICVVVSFLCYLILIVHTTKYTYVKHILLSIIVLVHLLTAYSQTFPMWIGYVAPCLKKYLRTSDANSTSQARTSHTSAGNVEFSGPVTRVTNA
uniref:uncharacterized protein LOC108949417 n=1 Tax=Ciona intestinalis TaxID=7719 RepID=UPI00089DC7A2|nr:uncharacterized protein LOC108949417 [Ciona intestinalis]|eukprot:XP_018666976.1 uncharacterized protein LOC108949417 [Ciona intestinalis]